MDHVLQCLPDLVGSDCREESGDHAGVGVRRPDVRHEALPDRVLAVLGQEHPVELPFDLGVGDALGLDHVLDVGMACAVQCEMADEPHQIRLAGLAVLRSGQGLAGGSEEIPCREPVHREPDLADGVPVQGVVVEQYVRPVEADVVELPVPLGYSAEVIRKPLKDIPPESVVGVCRRHVNPLGTCPRWSQRRVRYDSCRMNIYSDR